MTLPGRRFLHSMARTAVRALVAGLVVIVLAVTVFLVLDAILPFPVERLAARPISAVVTDRNGGVLAATVGVDGQWRRPVPLASMSRHLTLATVAVEDERFHMHPGVDPLAVIRAAMHGVVAGRVVSGASTITMQVARMTEPRRRTLPSKVIESFRALQLERVRTKDEILEIYLNLAPYGGNVRGAEAASQRWFGKPAARLTLAEAALLAGLPQSPERLRPDRHPDAAQARRDHVLDRMVLLQFITRQEAEAARATDVVLAPASERQPLAGLAPHAAALALRQRPHGGRTTIEDAVQRAALDVVDAARRNLPGDADIAIVAIDIEHGAVRALVGSADAADPVDGQVNGAVAWRSPGSTLKSFIYLAAFDMHRLAPRSVVPDRPIVRRGWTPQNFDRTFAGEVRAADALRHSLNVPAILVTEALGVERCVWFIEAAGVRLPPEVVTRTGLALAVGGAEVRLIDLVNGYATLGRGGVMWPWRLFQDDPRRRGVRIASPEACALVTSILRSEDDRYMWKTGTSAGRRDAWAVGHNGRFAVGVWVGRFSGVGDSAFVGGEAAAPILEALFGRPELASARRLTDDNEPAWPVSRPLAFDLGQRLRIEAPVNGATYRAVAGPVRLRPRVAGSGGRTLHWLLDGRPLEPSELGPLEPSPGSHVLHCVAESGDWSAVRFIVRD